MQVNETPFEGLLEIIPSIYHDDRGWFYEFSKQPDLIAAGIRYNFVQENQSFSKKGVVRGLHFQHPPHSQAKLVCVLMGKVLDVVVDMRPESKTFGKTFSIVIDSERRNMLMVPEGFAHGFAAIEDTLFHYKCSSLYHKASESGIHWNDPDLAIDWQTENPILSDKDKQLPSWRELSKKILNFT